uniref:Dimethyladenosine transferase 2, mitochondrial n=1 Tax=Anopheles minimus TaxID=112268 RepID=A0A182VZM2_9DIPT
MTGNSLHMSRNIFARWRNIQTALCRSTVNDAATLKPKVTRVRKPKATTTSTFSADIAVPKDVLEYFQSAEGMDASVLRLFPPSILRKSSLNTERFYIANRETAKQIASFVTKDLPPDRLLVEVNPGPGLLTEHIMKRKVSNLRLYETEASFESQLHSLLTMSKDVLRIGDFNGLWRLSYLDGFDNGRRVLKMLDGIPQRKWNDEVSFRLFSVVGTIKFLRYLMNSITHQSEFYSLGRYEMFLVMSPLLYAQISSTKTAGYKLYRGSTIVFQVYFEHELLGKVPRKHLLPWCTSGGAKKVRTLHQKLIEDGAEEWYLVKIMPRRNLHDHLLPDNLGLFASFVTQHYVSRRNRIIPSLEHWIPHCGARLILNSNYTRRSTKTGPVLNVLPSQLMKSMPLASNDYADNMNIYTEFGELTPTQVLTLFNEFINWSEFHQSPFMQAVESQKHKQRLMRQLDDEDTIDESNEQHAIAEKSIKVKKRILPEQSTMTRSERNFDTITKVICLGILIAQCCSMPASDVGAKPESNNRTELFAYPAEQSAIESKQNARNRTPIYIPKQCAENEILYPGDHENDWVCDCKPTYVYHPQTKQCYQMYTRGYCPSRQIVYIEPNGKNPVCLPNQCQDGEVYFVNKCVELNKEHDICVLANIKLVVGINEDTHQLECINISDVSLNRTMIKKSRD